MNESDSAHNLLPKSDKDEEEYEVLDVSELAGKRDSVMDQLIGSLASIKSQPSGEVAIGGAGGWLVGYLFKKFGRVAASSVGGSLLLLQLAKQNGYIAINWNKVNQDVNKAQRKINDEIHVTRSQIERMESKIRKIIKANAAVSIGFVGGFLLGLAT